MEYLIITGMILYLCVGGLIVNFSETEEFWPIVFGLIFWPIIAIIWLVVLIIYIWMFKIKKRK